MADNESESGLVVPPSGLISLDEARAAAEKRGELNIGARGMKRYCTRKETAEIAAQVAIDIAERTYNAIAKEHAEQMEKLEYVCRQALKLEIAAVRAEADARTLYGRWLRLAGWLKRQVLRIRPAGEEKESPGPEEVAP